MKSIIFTLILLLAFCIEAFANPLFYITTLGGEDINPLEPKNYGSGITEVSCETNCAENNNCGLWESPCVLIEIDDVPIEDWLRYCELDSESPNYCPPGNCVGSTPRYYAKGTDWGDSDRTPNPLFKQQAWTGQNNFPLYLNLTDEQLYPATIICQVPGDDIPPPESWYQIYVDDSILRVYWWEGIDDTTWQQAYTAGAIFQNWDAMQPANWPMFLDEDFATEFIARANDQTWLITTDYSSESCTCTMGYPGAKNIGANTTILLDTFGDDYAWNDYDAGDGYGYVSDSKLKLLSNNGGTPSTDDLARWERIGNQAASVTDVLYVTYVVKHITLGALGNHLEFDVTPGNASRFHVYHATDGLYRYYNGARHEVGTDINLICGSGEAVGCWQEWTFRIGVLGGAEQATYTFDAWVNDVQVADDVSWGQGVCCQSTNVAFRQKGNTISSESWIEFITQGNAFK